MDSWIEAFHSIAAVVEPLFDLAYDALWSLAAQRIYLLETAVALLAVSLYGAFRADRWADDNIKDATVEIPRAFLGPTVTLGGSFDRQQADIRNRARPLRQKAALSFLASLLAGVVVPTGMLIAATQYYSWLDPGAAHLLGSAGEPLSNPTWTQTLLFAGDQTFRGGVFDLMEVFDWTITPLDNNPANPAFTTGVVVHHLFIEAFIFSGVGLFALSLWRIRRLVRQTLANHRAKHEAAVAAKLAKTPA